MTYPFFFLKTYLLEGIMIQIIDVNQIMKAAS